MGLKASACSRPLNHSNGLDCLYPTIGVRYTEDMGVFDYKFSILQNVGQGEARLDHRDGTCAVSNPLLIGVSLLHLPFAAT